MVVSVSGANITSVEASAEERSLAQEPGSAPPYRSNHTTIRPLDPRLARYYFAYGVLAGERPPGGGDGARFGAPREAGQLKWQGILIDAADGSAVQAVVVIAAVLVQLIH